MRKPLIAGNWKMHKTIEEARALAREVSAAAAPLVEQVDALVAPPFTALHAVADELADSTVMVGAQNMHWADMGAFTGAISPPMVAELAGYVILGHSERRHVFGETDAEVNRKVHAAYAHGLVPIVCVGETLDQRESGETDDVVRSQLRYGIEGIAVSEATAAILAYEPVWAIGSGLPCDENEAARVSAFIRAALAEEFGGDAAQSVRVLYGGSVKPDNLATYLSSEDIDGALVGGASLDGASFADLLNVAADGS